MSLTLLKLLGVLLIANPEDAERVEQAAHIEEKEDDGGAAEMVPENAREAEKLTITSLRSDFDRKHGVVLFDGNAEVFYSAGYSVKADQLYVFFAHSNEVERLVAAGNVSVSNDTRLGVCASAVLRHKLGEVEMFGSKDGKMARLAEVGADEIVGRRIKFWVDTEQVEIEGSEIVFAKDSSGAKKVKKKGGLKK